MSKTDENKFDPRVSEIFARESPAIRFIGLALIALLGDQRSARLVDALQERGPDMRGEVAGKSFAHWYGKTRADLEREGLDAAKIREVERAHVERDLRLEGGGDPEPRRAKPSPAAVDEARRRAQAVGTPVESQSPTAVVLGTADGTPYDERTGNPGFASREQERAFRAGEVEHANELPEGGAGEDDGDDAPEGEEPQFGGHKFSDLRGKSDDALLALDNVGPKTVRAIRAHERKVARREQRQQK